MQKSYKTTLEDVKKRADKFLAEKEPAYSRAALTKLFKMQLVQIDNQIANPGDKLRESQQFVVDLGPIMQEPDVVELPIIYEDEDVLVVDKPEGIISHSRGRYWQEPSVASFIRSHVAKNLKGDRAGIVHRLDRATSGVMITAKNQKALEYLQDQFSKKLAEKQYVSLVRGVPKSQKATIEAAIARNQKDPKQFKVDVMGKFAQTYYEVHKSNDSNESYVLLWPKTGRTHQLRIHMSYIGCPIIGDQLYDAAHSIKEPRLYLHANKLKIKIPSGETREFISAIPEDFNKRYESK